MKRTRVRDLVAAVSALWLVAAMVVVSARIETQVRATQAIETELGDGTLRSTCPDFFDVARVMFRHGGWTLVELGGAPAIALIVIGISTIARRRRVRTTRFPSTTERF